MAWLDILWLVLVLAEPTEEEDVWVLGRRRAGCRWSEVYRYRWRRVTACARNGSPTGCMLYQMSDGMQSRWKKTDQYGGEKKTKTPCDVMIKKKTPKKLMVEGSLKKMIRPLQTVRNISISPQPNDYTACWKCEKPAQVQKKNNLLSVALIHFHSERQYLVLDRVCWYGLTEDSDAGTEQILYTFRSA